FGRVVLSFWFRGLSILTGMWGYSGAESSALRRILRLGDRHQRRSEDPAVQQVALLAPVDDGGRLLVRGQHADRLVRVRVELLTRRVQLADRLPLEHRL